jgi:hypothetical protein
MHTNNFNGESQNNANQFNEAQSAQSFNVSEPVPDNHLDQVNNTVDTSFKAYKEELKRLAVLAAEANSFMKIDPDDYTPTQQERLSELGGYYEEKDTEQIISHLTVHGENAYASIKEKVFAISNADFEETEKLQSALEEILVVNKFTPSTRVIQHATKTRRANKLKPYAKDALKNCVSAVFARHMFDVVKIEYKVGEKEKSEVIGYVPTFNLNCQAPL